MTLPNADRAMVEDAKLLDYCLSTTHPRGRHKARLFAAALGITSSEAALLAAARCGDAVETKRNPFGTMYETRFPCAGPLKTADVLSVWMVADADGVPRLVTCYPV